MKTSMKFILAGMIVAIVAGMITPLSRASWGIPTVDGVRDVEFTRIYDGVVNHANYSVYLMNTGGDAYFYLEGIGNFTFQEFRLDTFGLSILVTSNVNFPGIHAFAFSADRRNLEFMLIRAFVSTTFTFSINGQPLTLEITFSTEPPQPPRNQGFGLTEFMQMLGNLAFSNGWLSVIFWVIFIIWGWRAMTRKIWIIRKSGSVQGVDFGRWIKEELVNIKGTRLWRHTFKTDAAKTVVVQEIYSEYNKEDLIGKTKFKRINGFWLVMPYLRLGTLRLREDQYFARKIFVKSIPNYITRVLYYILCWVPKLNDEIYRKIQFTDDSKELVKEIPFMYVSYAEDRVIEVYECSWKETTFDKIAQKEINVEMKRDLTKEEVTLLKAQTNLVKESLVQVGPKLKTRKFETLDEAINDKMAREELMAIHRYKESLLDHTIEGLNQRLETTIDTLQNERRERVEETQNVLDEINTHTDYLQQNMAHYIAKAIGMRSIGAGSRDILENVTHEALQDFMKHSDDIKKKALLEEQERVKELLQEQERLKNELKKRTSNDIVPAEIKIEHKNDEGDD